MTHAAMGLRHNNRSANGTLLSRPPHAAPPTSSSITFSTSRSMMLTEHSDQKIPHETNGWLGDCSRATNPLTSLLLISIQHRPVTTKSHFHLQLFCGLCEINLDISAQFPGHKCPHHKNWEVTAAAKAEWDSA